MSSKRRKKVIGEAKSFRGEFSFVNKDATNIDSKDHNAAVSWHVMNRYERWKKHEEAKKLRASVNIPTNLQQPDSSIGGTLVSSSGYHRMIHMLTGRKPEDEPAEAPYPPSPWHVENVQQSMLEVVVPSTSQAWTPTPAFDEEIQDFSFVPTAPRLDDSASLSPSDEAEFPPLVSRILSYAYGVVIPTTWPNESGKAKWTYEISRTWEECAAIREDSCYASALLCFFATLMAATTNNKDIASQACFFQVQAMTELRQKLSTATGGYDQLTLKAILKLFSAETALDNTAAARVHLKSLRTFVVAKGGVTMLESWFRENLLATDCYFALKYETRPLFPASEWSPGPLTQPWRNQLAQANILDEHSPNIDAGVEHINLRNIISDLRELFQVEEYVNSYHVPADDQLLRWRQLRKYDCLNRLAEHQLSVKIYPHLYIKPKLQLAICAAIALMTAMVLGCPEPIRSGIRLTGELHSKVREAKAEIEQISEDSEQDTPGDFDRVLHWIAYTGRLGEHIHPVPQAWSPDESKNATIQLDLSDHRSQRGVLRCVLYSQTLENEIQSSRSRRESEPRKGVYEACGMSWRASLEAVTQIESQFDGSPSTGKGKETMW